MTAHPRRPIGVWVITAFFICSFVLTICVYIWLLVVQDSVAARMIRERYGLAAHLVSLCIAALSLFALAKLVQLRKLAVPLFGAMLLANLTWVLVDMLMFERRIGALVGPLIELWMFVYVLRLQKQGVLS